MVYVLKEHHHTDGVPNALVFHTVDLDFGPCT